MSEDKYYLSIGIKPVKSHLSVDEEERSIIIHSYDPVNLGSKEFYRTIKDLGYSLSLRILEFREKAKLDENDSRRLTGKPSTH